jgi:branched-chain amino acid transport system ATP-binding protein
MREAAILCRGLVKKYEEVTAVDGLDLEVRAGECFGLLGPNGAGKTTTLAAIAGTIPLMGGDLFLDGQSIRGLSTYERTRRGVVLVPEGRSVFPSLSVAENLELVVRAATDDSRARAERLAEVWEIFPRLAERREQRAGTLSGGEQQMLALAHAWLTEPKLVLVDEVSLGLAPKLVDRIFEYLHQIATQGAALLLVEQYVSRALELADYVYILKKGRIQLVAEPTQLNDEDILASYLGV